MKFKHFSIEERELIQEMKWGRKSTRAIAEALGRSPSSISRELNRNYPECRKTYLPRLAHERALEHRMHRGRTRRTKNAFHTKRSICSSAPRFIEAGTDGLSQEWKTLECVCAGGEKEEFQRERED